MPLTIPDHAPFTGSQRMWLKGFLDGINNVMAGSASAATTGDGPAPATGGIPVTILWGSQTGNSEGLAKKLAKALTAKGHAPTVLDMAGVGVDTLPGTSHLLVITSTYGDGEPPDNAAALHKALHEAGAPSLANTRYAVLALGDSNYAAFCQCGRSFDQRLAALGATRLLPIVECDVEYEPPFTSWTEQLDKALAPA